MRSNLKQREAVRRNWSFLLGEGEEEGKCSETTWVVCYKGRHWTGQRSKVQEVGKIIGWGEREETKWTVPRDIRAGSPPKCFYVTTMYFSKTYSTHENKTCLTFFFTVTQLTCDISHSSYQNFSIDILTKIFRIIQSSFEKPQKTVTKSTKWIHFGYLKKN